MPRIFAKGGDGKGGMSVDTKKPTFNADAAEEYFSDLLTCYRKTANDIFRRDNEGRHASNQTYSAEYQKYVGMQIAIREVLEYFSKYELGDNYDLDRLRELVEADRDGRCVVLPVSTPTMAYTVNPQNGIISSGFYPTPGSVLHDTERGYAIAKTREAAEEALRKEQQDAAKV